jgi:predicted PurR-regulated permease PerM
VLRFERSRIGRNSRCVGFLDAFPHLLWIAVFLGLWRLVQDYLISPRVMGNKVELHPLAAIVAVLMGNEIAGVIGVYLSIPVAATLRILWVRWQHSRAQEPGVSGPVPHSKKEDPMAA